MGGRIGRFLVSLLLSALIVLQGCSLPLNRKRGQKCFEQFQTVVLEDDCWDSPVQITDKILDGDYTDLGKRILAGAEKDRMQQLCRNLLRTLTDREEPASYYDPDLVADTIMMLVMEEVTVEEGTYRVTVCMFSAYGLKPGVEISLSYYEGELFHDVRLSWDSLSLR